MCVHGGVGGYGNLQREARPVCPTMKPEARPVGDRRDRWGERVGGHAQWEPKSHRVVPNRQLQRKHSFCQSVSLLTKQQSIH